MSDISNIRHLYPFKSNYLNIDGHRYHYLDEGSGHPLVMLHGNPMWSFYFRNLVRHFSQNYRVIVPDHMGCGLSDKPQKYTYSLDKHIGNLDRLLGYLQLTEMTLVVHEWGAPIGLGYATRHPEQLKRLIVFNSAAFMDPHIRIPSLVKCCRMSLLGDILIRRMNGLLRHILKAGTAKRGVIKGDIKGGYLAPYPSYESRIAQLRFIQDVPWSEKSHSFPLIRDIERKLGAFRELPTLILWGEKDPVFPKGVIEKWKSLFTQAVVHRLPSAGHLALEEAFAPITSHIQNFLENP